MILVSVENFWTSAVPLWTSDQVGASSLQHMTLVKFSVFYCAKSKFC